MPKKVNFWSYQHGYFTIWGYEPDYEPGYLEPEVRVPFNSTDERSIPYLMLMPEDVAGNSFVILTHFVFHYLNIL